jgi:hypothetical protein
MKTYAVQAKLHVILVILISLSSCASGPKGAAVDLPPLRASDFLKPSFKRLRLEGLVFPEGQPFNPASLNGKHTLLIFWAATFGKAELSAPTAALKCRG